MYKNIFAIFSFLKLFGQIPTFLNSGPVLIHSISTLTFRLLFHSEHDNMNIA